MILEYHVERKKQVGHDIVGDFLSTESPKWFPNLKSALDLEVKSNKDFVKKYWEKIMTNAIPEKFAQTFKTVKACPAFTKLFKHSVVIKFPCDVMLETSEDGKIQWKCKNQFTALRCLSQHHPDQLGKGFGDCIIIKFEFDCTLNAKDTTMQFIDPMYWIDAPYKVAPGLVDVELLPLNVICYFPKINEKYIFDAGSTLAVMTFSNPITQIKEKDMRASIIKRLWKLDRFFYTTKSGKK